LACPFSIYSPFFSPLNASLLESVVCISASTDFPPLHTSFLGTSPGYETVFSKVIYHFLVVKTSGLFSVHTFLSFLWSTWDHSLLEIFLFLDFIAHNYPFPSPASFLPPTFG
jgi:hypothetical protein